MKSWTSPGLHHSMLLASWSAQDASGEATTSSRKAGQCYHPGADILQIDKEGRDARINPQKRRDLRSNPCITLRIFQQMRYNEIGIPTYLGLRNSRTENPRVNGSTPLGGMSL